MTTLEIFPVNRIKEEFPKEIQNTELALKFSEDELQHAISNQQHSILFQVPTEILKEIFTHLNSLSNVLLTCKILYHIGNDIELWKTKYTSWIRQTKGPLNVINKYRSVRCVPPWEFTQLHPVLKNAKWWRFALSFMQNRVTSFMKSNPTTTDSLFEYRTESENEIHVREGEEIVVLEDLDGWWICWKIPQLIRDDSFDMDKLQVGFYPSGYSNGPSYTMSMKSIFDCNPIRSKREY